jgi:hypothetical protein
MNPINKSSAGQKQPGAEDFFRRSGNGPRPDDPWER